MESLLDGIISVLGGAADDHWSAPGEAWPNPEECASWRHPMPEIANLVPPPRKCKPKGLAQI